MKNILKIGLKSKKAFEHLKKVDHKKINKTLDEYIKLIPGGIKILNKDI